MGIDFFKEFRKYVNGFKYFLNEGTIVFVKDGRYFSPVTALCYAITGKYYKSYDVLYAAAEVDLECPLVLERSNDTASGVCYSMLMDIIKKRV